MATVAPGSSSQSSLVLSHSYISSSFTASKVQMESIMMAVQVGVLLLLGLLHDNSGGTAGGVQ